MGARRERAGESSEESEKSFRSERKEETTSHMFAFLEVPPSLEVLPFPEAGKGDLGSVAQGASFEGWAEPLKKGVLFAKGVFTAVKQADEEGD